MTKGIVQEDSIITARWMDQNREALVRFLASDEYQRQKFMAQLSCAMPQYGHHIDTLARDRST